MHAFDFSSHSLLRRTFTHLKGIGPRGERHLWKQGIVDWKDLYRASPRLYRGERLATVQASLEASERAWDQGNLYFFHKALPSQDRWRMIPGALADIAYFDIEASGGGQPPLAYSTTIAFYFRGQLLQEHEPGLKRDLIAYILQAASMICTYSGATYDVPFLSTEYAIRFDKAHIDLCPWLRRQGFKGGLKSIQKQLPHLPQRTALDINGFDAVRLWRLFEKGEPGALSTLQTYNAEDALILEPLLVDAYNRELLAHPDFSLSPLVSRPQPTLSTSVDPAIYAYLKRNETALSPAEDRVEAYTDA